MKKQGHSSGVLVYKFHYGDKTHGTIENLNITADKEKYNIGMCKDYLVEQLVQKHWLTIRKKMVRYKRILEDFNCKR